MGGDPEGWATKVSLLLGGVETNKFIMTNNRQQQQQPIMDYLMI